MSYLDIVDKGDVTCFIANSTEELDRLIRAEKKPFCEGYGTSIAGISAIAMIVLAAYSYCGS